MHSTLPDVWLFFTSWIFPVKPVCSWCRLYCHLVVIKRSRLECLRWGGHFVAAAAAAALLLPAAPPFPRGVFRTLSLLCKEVLAFWVTSCSILFLMATSRPWRRRHNIYTYTSSPEHRPDVNKPVYTHQTFEYSSCLLFLHFNFPRGAWTPQIATYLHTYLFLKFF